MILIILLLLITLTIILRTIKLKNCLVECSEKENNEVDLDRIVSKLSGSIKIPTVSFMETSKIDYSEFNNFIKFLEKSFPYVFRSMEVTVINDYSLLFKWSGREKSKKPSLLMAHYDVVPVAESSEEGWKFSAFSGAVDDGYLYGRGSLDTKITLVAALEAAELLLEDGFTPQNDVYFAFGHDEEISGINGAKNIAKYLKDANIELEFVLDEGGIVTPDSINGSKRDFALVGIAEKGYADIKISVKGDGGHSSMPSKSTSLGMVAQTVSRLEKQQMKLKLTKPVELFLKKIGPEIGTINRVIIANLWLFKPLFIKIFSKTNSGNALLRTTTAVTMAKGSNAANVIPEESSAIINFRISPEDSVSKIVDHIKNVSRNPDLKIEILKSNEPTPVSKVDSFGFNLIEKIIPSIFDNTVVAPYLVMAATDSKYFHEICDSVYRFAPLRLTKSELGLIHNTNERVSLENIKKALLFYIELISNV